MRTKALTRREAVKLGAAGGVAAATGLAAPAILRAQSYPDRPINMVIPFATGGYNDRLARAFQPFLQEEIGQPIVIVNRPGAGTLLGNMYFLQQPDDGYTMQCNSVTPYIPMTILLQDAQYRIEDFWMLNLPSRDYTLAATASDGRLQSWEQVVEELKADPGSVSLGVQPGSADFLNLMLAVQAEGIDAEGLRIVTYDGGGPTRTAAAGGHVDVGFVGAEGFLPLRDRITPLLLFADQRMEGFDDTPAAAEYNEEHGVEMEYLDGSQRGWVVHTSFRDNHPDRYEILLGAVERASKNPDAIRSLQEQQLATEWYGPEESNETYRRTSETLERYADLLDGA